MKKMLITTLLEIFITCFMLLGGISIGQAYTGEISLNGINNKTNAYDYLNSNSFHLFKSMNSNDVYINSDNSVLVTVSRRTGGVLYVDIVKSGYETNRGIQVGMNLNDLRYAYGNVYPLNGYWRNHGDESNSGYISSVGVGSYYKYARYNYKQYAGYDVVSYQEPVSSLEDGETADGVQFVMNRKTKKIVLMHYYATMHRNVDIIMYADQLGILDKAR